MADEKKNEEQGKEDVVHRVITTKNSLFGPVGTKVAIRVIEWPKLPETPEDESLELGFTREEILESLCGQAYVVIGSLASDLDVLEQPAVEKVLDNLSEMKFVHNDALPFPSFDKEDILPGNKIEAVMAELCFPEASGTCVDRIKYLVAELDKARRERDERLGAVGYVVNRAQQAYDEAMNYKGMRTNGPLRIPVEASHLYYMLGHQPKGLPGYKVLKDSIIEERSWPEDSSHENGNYFNNCITCLRQFTGHKRRAICKVCSE